MAKLTKTQIDNLLGKPQTKQLEIPDGNNLYLFVSKVGSCRFKYRNRKQNKATWVSIGEYPDITLNEARKQALDIRAMISKGINPTELKKQEQAKLITVAQLATSYINERLPIARPKKNSADDFKRAIQKDIVDIIGNTLVKDITIDIIKTKLINTKLANGSPSVARRTKINMQLLLDFAIENCIIDYNPARHIKSDKIYRDKPRKRYLSESEIKIFLNQLYRANIKTQHKLAFHLSLMLLTRKTELIHATWDNIDFSKQMFVIKQSKMDKELVIPLPHQAVTMFEMLKNLSSGSEYIFIGRGGIHQPISSTTLNGVLRPFNIFMFGENKDMYFTIHDLRRTAATLLGERGNPSDYIEVALNHSKGALKETYQRSSFLEQRKQMLQEWANWLDSLLEDNYLDELSKLPI